LSLRNFLCNFVTFWSSQGNLSNKKSRKTEENNKKKNVSRFGQGRMHCFDIEEMCHDGQNVTQSSETLIQFLATQDENLSRFT